jgi:hypothetical protein
MKNIKNDIEQNRQSIMSQKMKYKDFVDILSKYEEKLNNFD